LRALSFIALRFIFVILSAWGFFSMIKYYDISGTQIACWAKTGDFDPGKKSVLFIHGSGSNHSLWAHQYGRLHKDFNVAAVNLPGHAPSGSHGEKDVRRYGDWIQKTLAAIGWGKTVLVGHSLGSAVALRSALDFPDDLAGIVCVGGGMKMPVNSLFLDFLQTHPPSMPAEIVDLICKLSLAKENRAELSAALQMSIAQAKVDVMYGDLFACNALDITQEADNITVPALIVCGAEDKMTPPDLSRALAATISGAKLVLVEGAGHMVMLEQPLKFNAVLRDFISALQ